MSIMAAVFVVLKLSLGNVKSLMNRHDIAQVLIVERFCWNRLEEWLHTY